MLVTPQTIALGVSYAGNAYYGWQIQPNVISIQSVLESSLAKIACEPIKVFCAGRTDKGVHALMQVAHFKTTVLRPEKAWVLGTNTHLPHDIRVQWAQSVKTTFHARFSAFARHYRYIVYNHPIGFAPMAHAVTWYRRSLDVQKMNMGAHYLLGEHDFTSFRGAGCQAHSPIRCIHSLTLTRHGRWVVVDISANAFLLHMVRNIMHVLFQVGQGDKSPEWVDTILAAKQCNKAGQTASPAGLYLRSNRLSCRTFKYQ